jgi:hypothetical protein
MEVYSKTKMLKRSKKRYLKKSLKKFQKKSYKGGVGKSRTQKAKDMLWNKRDKKYKNTVKGVGVLVGTLYAAKKLIKDKNNKNIITTSEGIKIININKKICDIKANEIVDDHNEIKKNILNNSDYKKYFIDKILKRKNIDNQTITNMSYDVFHGHMLNDYNLENDASEEIVQINYDKQCNVKVLPQGGRIYGYKNKWIK